MRFLSRTACSPMPPTARSPMRFSAVASALFLLGTAPLLLGCGSASAAEAPAPATPAAPAESRTVLAGGTVYPRVLRLSHGPAATNSRIIASTDGVIFRSDDNGATFTRIATVTAKAGSRRVCCSTLYEVPRTVGSLSAGTLLSAGTYTSSADGVSPPPPLNGTDYNGGSPAIEIYKSTDAGVTWTWLATPVMGGPALPSTKPAGQRGLWEPEFTVSTDGALVMFVSDETDACCSQKLIKIRTYDGSRWQDKSDVIRSADNSGRPGMIVVSGPLPSGRFFMTNELCGGSNGCTVYSRTSSDGWNFGDPSAAGTKVVSSTGQYFQHAPANLFAAGAGASGKLLLIGQVLFEKDGTVSPQNGTVFFTSTDLDGKTPWTPQAAPVPVPTAYDNFCPNYSSALLPGTDGSTVLELASDYDATHTCRTYFRTGALR